MSDTDGYEPMPVPGGTPLERLMETGQALIDEARAALAERQREEVATTDEFAARGPAYITVGDYEAALVAAEAHELTLRGGRHEFTDLECSTCGALWVASPLSDLIRAAARHTVEVALKAARVEVQRG